MAQNVWVKMKNNTGYVGEYKLLARMTELIEDDRVWNLTNYESATKV